MIKTTGIRVSKMLLSAGWSYKTRFYISEQDNIGTLIADNEFILTERESDTYFGSIDYELLAFNNYKKEQWYPAPTVSELLDVLPKRINDNTLFIRVWWKQYSKDNIEPTYLVGYYNMQDMEKMDESIEDSLGLLFIDLKKRGLI